MTRSSAFALAVTAIALAACGSSPRESQRIGPDQLESGRVMKPAALLFATFDANYDFQITPDELSAGLERSFDTIDTDDDGTIGLIEHARWSERVSGSETARPGRFDFDSNADSRITRDEFNATLEDFARRYAGADGVIQFSELSEDAPIGGYMRRMENRELTGIDRPPGR
ncbi:hypothetical protein [Euryhalocaulis caribicus]|uniref:hypothetical protein n=1 Tax=Euryhalocaulis caribicus TaxID=1161401 RepID=UPI0003A35035|nr:hypothetical protein [Euryhalocaulis caribicus]